MVTFEFIDNSYTFYPLLPTPLVCEDKMMEKEWLVQNFILETLVANSALII